MVLSPIYGAHNAPRCVRRVHRVDDETEYAQYHGPEYQSDIPLFGVGYDGEAAWARIQELGRTDWDLGDDKDGILGLDDYCPLVANPTQEDPDSDGSGDACDPDVDEDDVTNALDICAFTPLGS